jgi:hypothetical protein
MRVAGRRAGLRPGLWWAWLVLLLAVWTASLANKPAPKPGAAASAAGSAATTSEAQRLVRRYDAAQRVVLKEQLCLRTPSCFTDEGRLLDAMETSKRLSQALADRAQGGDAEAAYERGMIALRAAQSHGGRSLEEAAAQLRGSSAVLRRRESQETTTAEKYLSMAAVSRHPAACLALADLLAARVHQSEPLLVARLYRCAVVGFSGLGDRAAAIDAFVKMRDVCSPVDPMLIEAHTVIYRNKLPDRPWRQVEPDEALALRKQTAP